ncbi:MAG TPA: hypothetical protein VGN57_08305 [Pirellulaceae bacterium]|jgi:hypothetical protein|nr:hypothetical protein [Pirellulaceae bacterium]
MDETAKPRRFWKWSLAGCFAAMLWLGAYFGGRNAGYDAGHAQGTDAAHPRALAIGWVEGFRETRDRLADDKLYEEVYSVGDLMHDRLNKRPGEALSDAEVKAVFDQLIREITQTVDPSGWPEFGGTGGASLRGFPTNRTLVVTQTAGNHAEIASYLYSKDDYLAWKKATETR